MTITEIAPQAGTGHTAVTGGLRNLAAFLDGHPDLPLSTGPSPLTVFAHGTDDAEARAEVDRIAAILGVTAAFSFGRNTYKAVRDFGGGVTYEAIAIASAYSGRYDRHMKPFHAEEMRRLAVARDAETRRAA